MTPSQPAHVLLRELADSAKTQPSPLRFALSLAILSLCLFFGNTATARPYTVKSGDTLQRIAQRELGSANRWPEIARLNNLPPPHTIRLGQQLTLPDQQAGMIPLAPPTPTNAPAPPSPIVPPGNTVPLDPFNTVVTPITHDSPPWSSIEINWWWALLILPAIFLVHALILRISSWFSLVETTYLICLKLAVYLFLFASLSIATVFAVTALIGFGAGMSLWPLYFDKLFLIIPITGLGWFILSLVIIKRTLDCKWRSVVTILTMSSFVAWALSTILILSIASGPFIQALMKGQPKP